jgi:hypothetical protein
MSYLSNDRRICWSRPRAASSAEQRFKIHRSFRRHATLLEKRRRRMGLESRVASHRDYMELGVKSISGVPKSVQASPWLPEKLRLW